MSLRYLKEVLFIFLAAACCFGARADFRILALNTPAINIGGKQLKVNDTFADNAPIKWSSPQQAMKVLDSATGRQRLVTGSEYSRAGSSDLASFFSGTRRLSSRDGAPDNPVALKAMIGSDTHYFCDSLLICTAMPTDYERFFFVSYIYGGEEINKLIANDNGSFVITPDIFTVDGKPIPPFEADLALYYIDRGKGTVTLVTDTFRISLVSFTKPIP